MINLKNEKQKLSFLRLRGASGAQGISTPASCHEAHKRRFILNPWILHFAFAQLKMTIPTLAFLLSLNISESRAAWSDNCPSGTTAGTSCKQCGTDCAFTEDTNHAVTLYGSGEVGDVYTYKKVNGKYGYYDANNNPNPFYNNTSITGVQFSEGSNVTSIGVGAFMNASSLTSITIPDSVTSIGNGAFYNASNLSSVTFGEKSQLKSIGNSAFYGVTGLTNITIPDSVISIEGNAFYNASNLTNVTIPDSVKKIEHDAFAGTGITSITLPDSLETIGGNAFSYTGLTSITIPDSVTNIEWTPFFNNNSLTEIIIPDSWADGNVNLNNMLFANSCFSSSYATSHSSCANAKIVCQGGTDNCYKALAKFFSAGDKHCPTGITCNCSSNCIDSGLIVKATSASQCSGIYGWSGAGCSRKNTDGSVDCASGFVEWDKQCLSEYPFAKKRWTPAEASQWLHDGNDNFVVITFKK